MLEMLTDPDAAADDDAVSEYSELSQTARVTNSDIAQHFKHNNTNGTEILKYKYRPIQHGAEFLFPFICLCAWMESGLMQGC